MGLSKTPAGTANKESQYRTAGLAPSSMALSLLSFPLGPLSPSPLLFSQLLSEFQPHGSLPGSRRLCVSL